MKKLLSFFLTLILIFSVLSISCFADNPVKLTLDSETDTVYAGDEFVVKLMISDNSKMSGAAIDINYDKNCMEFVSGTFGGILDSSATKSLKNLNGDKSKVRFTYLAPSSAVTSQGVLVTLKFKALENAHGESELTISIPNPGDFVSQDLSRLSYTVENTRISIKNNTVETESVTEAETESQSAETTSETKKTAENVQNVDDGDSENTNKIILAVVIFGAAILVVVVLLVIQPTSKKKKGKK